MYVCALTPLIASPGFHFRFAPWTGDDAERDSIQLEFVLPFER